MGSDSVESIRKEGKEWKLVQRVVKSLQCGVWKYDALFQGIQEFESEVMIKYEVKEERRM